VAKLERWVAKLERWVAKLERWVAKLGRWVAKLRRWVAKLWRWVAKLVARLLATVRQLSVFESRHLSKIQNWRHKHRSGQHTLARKKKTI
jgi:hypothetical protein